MKFSTKKILAVDDASENFLFLEMLLQDTGVELTYSDNGLEAFQLCQKKQFDLILMDIQMSPMNGYEATASIRQTGLTVPIIALTSHSSQEVHDKCLSAGCNAVLVKPVNKIFLIQTLQLYLVD